jgi:hypothetical protein
MTPYQRHLAEQASTEMDSRKLLLLVAELSDAIDNDCKENRRVRQNCVENRREQATPFLCD